MKLSKLFRASLAALSCTAAAQAGGPPEVTLWHNAWGNTTPLVSTIVRPTLTMIFADDFFAATTACGSSPNVHMTEILARVAINASDPAPMPTFRAYIYENSPDNDGPGRLVRTLTTNSSRPLIMPTLPATLRPLEVHFGLDLIARPGERYWLAVVRWDSTDPMRWLSDIRAGGPRALGPYVRSSAAFPDLPANDWSPAPPGYAQLHQTFSFEVHGYREGSSTEEVWSNGDPVSFPEFGVSAVAASGAPIATTADDFMVPAGTDLIVTRVRAHIQANFFVDGDSFSLRFFGNGTGNLPVLPWLVADRALSVVDLNPPISPIPPLVNYEVDFDLSRGIALPAGIPVWMSPIVYLPLGGGTGGPTANAIGTSWVGRGAPPATRIGAAGPWLGTFEDDSDLAFSVYGFRTCSAAYRNPPVLPDGRGGLPAAKIPPAGLVAERGLSFTQHFVTADDFTTPVGNGEPFLLREIGFWVGTNVEPDPTFAATLYIMADSGNGAPGELLMQVDVPLRDPGPVWEPQPDFEPAPEFEPEPTHEPTPTWLSSGGQTIDAYAAYRITTKDLELQLAPGQRYWAAIALPVDGVNQWAVVATAGNGAISGSEAHYTTGDPEDTSWLPGSVILQHPAVPTDLAMHVLGMQLEPPPNFADADASGDIGLGDLAVIIQNWGAGDSPGDVTFDGSTGLADLALVIQYWGATGP